MKKIIENLKYYTGHKSDKSFAEFVGFSENTITRAKAGHKTKLNAVLPMLEWLLKKNNTRLNSIFLKKFKDV